VTAVAILLFLSAPFLLCCNGYYLASVVGQDTIELNGKQFDWNVELAKHTSNHKLFVGGKSAVGVVLAIVGVVAGTGLLMMKNWGRYLALGWAGCYLLFVVLGLGYEFVVYIPAKQKVFDTLAVTQTAVNVARPMVYLWAVLSVILMLTPGFALFLLNGASAKRAFAGLPPEDDWPEEDRRSRRDRDDYDDEDEPRRRRRDDDDRDDDDRYSKRRRRDD